MIEILNNVWEYIQLIGQNIVNMLTGFVTFLSYIPDIIYVLLLSVNQLPTLFYTFAVSIITIYVLFLIIDR